MEDDDDDDDKEEKKNDDGNGKNAGEVQNKMETDEPIVPRLVCRLYHCSYYDHTLPQILFFD